MARDKKSESGDEKTGVARWKDSSEASSAKASKGNRAKDRGAKATGTSRAQRRPRPAETNQQLVLLVVAAVVVVLAVVAMIPPAQRLGWGLDFAGGSYVRLAADADATSDDVDDAAAILKKRLTAVGMDGYRVSVSDDDSILVQYTDDDDQTSVVSEVVETGYFEFVRIDAISDAAALDKIESGTTGFELEEGTYTAFLDSSDVESAQVSVYSSTDGTYYLTITFDDEGAETFEEVTGLLASTYGQIAILVDGVVIAAPTVSSAIEGGTVSIYSAFSYAVAVGYGSALTTGALPCDFEVSESGTVSPVIGSGQLVFVVVGTLAVLVVALVLLWMTLKGLGLIAFAALVDACVVELGMIGLLSAIGSFVPSVVGYLGGIVAVVGTTAASAYLLVTFRREVREGKLARDAARGILRTTTKPLAIVVIVAFALGIVLFLAAPANLDDFGIALAAGVLVAAIVISTLTLPLLRLNAAGSMREKPEFWGIVPAGRSDTSQHQASR